MKNWLLLRAESFSLGFVFCTITLKEWNKFGVVIVKYHLLDDIGGNLVADSDFSKRSNRMALVIFQA